MTAVHLKLVNKAGTVIGEVKSDAEGNFTFEGIEPGQYRLTAEETSFVPVISDVSVVNGQQEQVSLQFRQLASVSQDWRPAQVLCQLQLDLLFREMNRA